MKEREAVKTEEKPRRTGNYQHCKTWLPYHSVCLNPGKTKRKAKEKHTD